MTPIVVAALLVATVEFIAGLLLALQAKRNLDDAEAHLKESRALIAEAQRISDETGRALELLS